LLCPTTLMHMHVIEVMLKNTPCASIEELRKQGRGRIVTVSSTLADSTGKLLEIARDIGRPRNDVYENIVFTNMFSCREDRLVLIQAVHQEAIVIPENIDVAYGIMNIETDVYKVVDKVNSLLGIGQLHVM